jgi:hypothetical protein
MRRSVIEWIDHSPCRILSMSGGDMHAGGCAGTDAKRCPKCGAVFSRLDLIEAPTIVPLGIQHIEGEPPSRAIYFFTHALGSCYTTFALPVETFREHLGEAVPETFLQGTAACRMHCSKIEELSACDAPCTLAPFRRFLLQRLVPRR